MVLFRFGIYNNIVGEYNFESLTELLLCSNWRAHGFLGPFQLMVIYTKKCDKILGWNQHTRNFR